jgi:hypothetical protein
LRELAFRGRKKLAPSIGLKTLDERYGEEKKIYALVRQR